MEVLHVDGVSLSYGDRTVLRNVTFTCRPGDVVGIAGPNGCGKSTLIKGITGLLPLRSGSITVAGVDTGRMQRSKLAQLVAVVPQNPSLPEAFTALEIVLMGRTPHLGFLGYESQRDIDIAMQAMEATGTADLAARHINELSGGERQRVTIARALAQEPRLLLLDEPTAHLDINYQTETLNLISDLCVEKSLTALVALHDLNLASQYCHRIIMIGRGGVHAIGSPKEVITVDSIREVYGTEICICPHPLNDLPAILVTANGRTHRPAQPAS